MASFSSPEESQQQQQEQQQQLSEQPVKEECVHKTKVIQFLGRNTPIVLQNENGPCPLLAICNVLLLRNNLNLGPDQAEISQERLLSLVAERLIDSNINVNNKDAGYVENQQQNIADAIDHLPRLATGIDVNIKFRRIDDFEFTPECAIFDLLDIPLYHGWIVDPQDQDTARAIDSKSYNALMEELVALETRNMKDKNNTNPEEDCIDFAAATTATLGVPSPSLSKTLSFDETPPSVSEKQGIRKGDLEEEAELLRILRISEGEVPATMGNDTICHSNGGTSFINFDEEASPRNIVDAINTKAIQIGVENDNTNQPESATTDVCQPSIICDNNVSPTGIVFGQVVSSSASSDLVKHTDHFSVGCEKSNCCTNLVEKNYDQGIVEAEVFVASFGREGIHVDENYVEVSKGKQKDNDSSDFVIDSLKPAGEQRDFDAVEVKQLSVPGADSDLSSSRMQATDQPVGLTSRIAAASEPIYEGEECILDRETTVFEDREPVYEGEVILAEQAGKNTSDAGIIDAKEDITPNQGDLISNFLKNSASQLTIFGLFRLQDGLKERELCVFFRNNHFSTLFKLDDQLYILATDQGYINQPDLVWEKLNEVNGDTLFMTGNFKEFKVESNANETWNEHTAMTSTADYLASIDLAAHSNSDMNSDLQLAIALQQQEFEQQPQHHTAQQPSVGSSRLITGPQDETSYKSGDVEQVPRNSGRNLSQGSASSSSKTEAKSKDKCCVM